MIEITINNNKSFLWNAEDIVILRKNYRIVGKCIGCSPSAPYQYATLNLPVQIPEAAAKLLEQKGIACLIDSESVCHRNSKPTEEQFKEIRNKLFADQVQKNKEDRQEFISKNANNIIKGKLKKLNKPIDEASKEAIVQELYNEIQPICESASLIQIFTQCPWPRDTAPKSTWNYPKTEEEITRYETYKHFWEKGYYITPGEKFGGDYLVYPGDPEEEHSKFIVVCKPHNEKISMLEMVTKGRLATSVKKTILFSSVVDGTVSIISLNWTHWI